MAWLSYLPTDTAGWQSIRVLHYQKTVNLGGASILTQKNSYEGLTSTAALASIAVLNTFSTNGLYYVDNSSLPFTGGSSLTISGFGDTGTLPASSRFRIDTPKLNNVVFKTTVNATVSSGTTTLSIAPSLPNANYMVKTGAVQWLTVGQRLHSYAERANAANGWRVVDIVTEP